MQQQMRQQVCGVVAEGSLFFFLVRKPESAK